MTERGFMRRAFLDRIERIRRIFARATAWPFAVRLTVFAAAMLAQSFAYPTRTLFGAPIVAMLLLAALPALWPRTAAVSTFWLITVVGWILSTTFFDGVTTLIRLVGLSACLYLVHTTAALAAALPYDAVVDPVVVARWLLRAAMILAISLGFAVTALYAVTDWSNRTYLAATLIGLVPAVTLVWVLAWVARRPR
jgi:hypothetical protein